MLRKLQINNDNKFCLLVPIENESKYVRFLEKDYKTYLDDSSTEINY